MANTVALGGLLSFVAVMCVLAAGAAAEQASQPAAPVAGGLDVAKFHACALLAGASVRCWGYSGDGELGYANTNTIGDDETPAAAGPVDFGAGRTVTALSAGANHTCAVLDDGTVRCWGFSGDGQLGYANTNTIGDNEAPGAAGPVDLGGRAKAIAAGTAHTCAVLDDGTVSCWGYGANGRLGYGNENTIGDNETPRSAGKVKLGVGRTATAITAGESHTCALLDNSSVLCWGYGGHAELGNFSSANVGDNETPDKASTVLLGTRRTAVAISAGTFFTCALLDDATVKCWGYGANGRLGTASTDIASRPFDLPPMDLGAGRTAVAISAGSDHACAVLNGGDVRCWGAGANGRLGYGNENTIGDDELPGSVGPVDLGAGRTAVAISAGATSTCARLDDSSVRCWGNGSFGRLGYCNTNTIGDDETPGPAGPVDLGVPGSPGAGGARTPGARSATTPGTGAAQDSAPNMPPTVDAEAAPLQGQLGAAEAARARGLRRCLTGVARHAQRETRLARRGSARRRAAARSHLSQHARSGRQRCLRLYGRTPGRITGLRALALGTAQLKLSFNAPGTDGSHPPAAQSYLIKQALRPIRSARDFARAQALCKGHCRFTTSTVGDNVSLTVSDLRPHTTYYYAVAARDNVSAKQGPRSETVKATTR